MGNISVKELGRQRLLRQILCFVLPLIATSVLQLLFNTADTVVVGRFGGDTPEECEAALAAVGSCGSLINLVVNLFLGLSIGAGVCVARAFGAEDHASVSRTVHTAIPLAAVLGVLVTLIGFFGASTFLSWMGTDAAAMEQATRYMKAYFLGMPAAMIYNYCAAMLRATGDTVHPLLFLSAGGILNVGLNLFAVIVLRLGAMGVGLATAASNWLACILVLIYMLRRGGVCHVEPRKLRITGSTLRAMLYIGIPAGIQSSLFSISNVLIQTAVNSFGSTALVAANTAASNLEGYIYTVQNAFAQAALTFVGQSVGARNSARAHRATVLCCACVTVAGLTLGALTRLCGDALLSIFIPENPEAVAIGLLRLSSVVIPYFLCGLMEVGCNALRGLGKSLQPMIVSLIGACALRIVWIYTLFRWFPSIEMLFLSYPVTWTVTALVQFILYAFYKRRADRDLAAPAT